MNERIRELAAKAGIYGAVDINGNFDNEAEVKKFAELIVRECAETIRGSMIKHCTGVILNTDYNLGLSKASTSIKEHFGVEE